MMLEGRRILFCLCILFTVPNNLVESTTFPWQEADSKSQPAQGTERLSTSSIHRTSEIVQPSEIRNKRHNLLSNNEQFTDDNAGLDSAFLYSDQIMQNLLKNPKPLSYARSNFFLNILKPRTTRYNAWDDHSLMHFGKRSVKNANNVDKVVVKRSTDEWSPDNVLHFGKKSTAADETDSTISLSPSSNDMLQDKEHENEESLIKKSADPWHSMMSFGKKSQIPLSDDNYDLAKKDDPWHHVMSFGKRSENPWDSSTLHFGKRDEPWHHVMSFGKRSENPWDSSTLHFGKKDDPWHHVMSFGKRSENPWDSSTLHFGKRDEPWHHVMSFGKRSENPWDSSTLHFGKRDDPWHQVMSFGKKSDPWHNMMSFGKKSENPWDHNTLHFGKRDEPWHNMMSFGKKSDYGFDHNTLHFGKRDEPWHNMMSFGKKNDPWHNMMSFGKKYDSSWDHNTLHFGKRDDPWHNMMSFGKRFDESDVGDLAKRDDPWHNMMSFGKKSDNAWDNDTTYADKREEPWHNMMSFGKRSENPWDHNTLHFGKRDEPWHNMMSFGKKSENPWDHNTLHFGKRDEPWHNMMSFGKKSESPWEEHNTMHFGKRNDPWHNMMSFGKRSNDLLEDFEHHSNPWEEYNGMQFNKKADPWDHNTLHFGKRSNVSLSSIASKQNEESKNSRNRKKRSIDMWNDHDTMHFGKKSEPWEDHNTMHFGKKSYPWEDHNTMHFGKKSDPWEDHNTMHFGKKSDPWEDHNTMHFGKKSDPWEDHNTMHFGKKSDPWENHNTMHFGKKSDLDDLENTIDVDKKFDWDNHNTMHFGRKRDPFDYHNTMHFGKRNPWEQHNTMHFGKKRDPWDYHNTMHFGKRSNFESKDASSVSQEDMQGKEGNTKLATTVTDDSNVKENLKKEKATAVKKRSIEVSKSITKSKSNLDNNKFEKTGNEGTEKLSSVHQKFALENRVLKRSLKSTESDSDKNAIAGDSKQETDRSFTQPAGDKTLIKPSIPPNQKYSAKQETHSSENEVKSRINKRSIQSIPLNNDLGESIENVYPSRQIFEQYSNDDFPESVLHFGKRSVEYPEENEADVTSQFDVSESKRFDDYWDSHNTMHFGKKSSPWDHSTMHFGKRDPWDHSTMHFGKRDPWDYHNTLHFGKKFDPWEGHAKMHFGKRSPDWNHNVMHFGKRGDLTPEDLQNARNAEDLLAFLFDPMKLNDYIQAKYNQQGMNAQENDEFLSTVANLETIVNTHLKDESIPFEEKLMLLRSYLKPMLKILLDDQLPEETFFYPNDKELADKDLDNFGEGVLVEPSRTIIRDPSYDQDVFPAENEESNNDEYEDDTKTSYLTGNKYSKRSYLGKPELKRYFIPFQGPKSIVYPHAWFASQIRRSSLPRTTDYAKNMEMRMAEKKEDPFNSYMHFGRR